MAFSRPAQAGDQALDPTPSTSSRLDRPSSTTAVPDLHDCLVKKFQIDFDFPLAQPAPTDHVEMTGPLNAPTSPSRPAGSILSSQPPTEADLAGSTMLRAPSVMPGRKADDELLAKLAQRWTASEGEMTSQSSPKEGRTTSATKLHVDGEGERMSLPGVDKGE